MCHRLDRRRGQRTAQIGFMNPDQAQASELGVPAEPAERQLVGRSEDDERVGYRMPVTGERRVGDHEIDSRVRRLAGLRPWREIGAGDEVKTTGTIALTVRHTGSMPTSMVEPNVIPGNVTGR